MFRKHLLTSNFIRDKLVCLLLEMLVIKNLRLKVKKRLVLHFVVAKLNTELCPLTHGLFSTSAYLL